MKSGLSDLNIHEDPSSNTAVSLPAELQAWRPAGLLGANLQGSDDQMVREDSDCPFLELLRTPTFIPLRVIRVITTTPAPSPGFSLAPRVPHKLEFGREHIPVNTSCSAPCCPFWTGFSVSVVEDPSRCFISYNPTLKS